MQIIQTEFIAVKIEKVPLSLDEQAIHSRAVRRAQSYRNEEVGILTDVSEVDQLRIWEKLGYPNLTIYCRKELQLSETMIGYFIMVARKSRQTPELKVAVDQGKLSVSTAAQIVGVITPETQTEWIADAKCLTKRELEKKAAEARPEKKKRSRLKPVGRDRNRVEFEQSDEFISFLRRAEDLESQRQGRQVSLEDVMHAVFEFYLEHRDPLRKASRAEARKARTARAQKDAPHTSREVPRSDPRPSSARPQTRPQITAAMKHELNLRDQGRCQVQRPTGEKCESQRFIQFHHVIELSQGGRHEVSNMITVCGSCHRRLHLEYTRRFRGCSTKSWERPIERGS